MDGLKVFLIFLLGLVSSSHDWNFEARLKTVRPGDNITLYCDCKSSSGAFVVWFRNCSHENQPSLVLRTQYMYDPSFLTQDDFPSLSPFPRLHLVTNRSSDSYDLLIVNITESDEGLYYCGTEQKTFNSDTKIPSEYTYRYGNIMTRVLLNASRPNDVPDCGSCWKLLFSLCPTVAVLSALLSSLLVYKLAQKKAVQLQDVGNNSGGQTGEKQDEDVCYGAIEIRQASKRPKMKKSQNSQTFCTYSAINISRV